MKKLICTVLALMLLLFSAQCFAVDTLPEKMQKQLDFGSGLKGSFTMQAEGNDPLVLALQPFLNVELQFRGIRSGDQSHFYFYQASENEEQKGLTEILNSTSDLYLRTDMLPAEIYHFPGIAGTADELTAPPGGNPSVASLLIRWLSLDQASRSELLNPVLERLGSQLEIWVAQYASVSQVRVLENGSSEFDINYVIPMEDLKSEIVLLMKDLIQSESGQKLLKSVMNEAQLETYANINLDYFYQDALSAQNIEYDVLYTRTISTLGLPVSSVLELPLDEGRTGYQAAVIEDHGGLTSYTLRGEDRIVTLMAPELDQLGQADAFSAWLILRPGTSEESGSSKEYHAWRMDVSRSGDTSTDEEARDHERTQWEIHLERDVSRLPEGENPDLYPEESPVDLSLKLHYFSRYSQSSPTTLEFDAALSAAQISLSVQGSMKTASPWAFSPFQTEGAVDFRSLSISQIGMKTAEFLAAAGEILVPDVPEASDADHQSAEDGAEPETESGHPEESPEAVQDAEKSPEAEASGEADGEDAHQSTDSEGKD